jgi:hypothetical protein
VPDPRKVRTAPGRKAMFYIPRKVKDKRPRWPHVSSISESGSFCLSRTSRSYQNLSPWLTVAYFPPDTALLVSRHTRPS